jgi:hypothetical protein
MAITLDGSNLTTNGVINRSTAQSASGTSVDFSIPIGANRITVMLTGVSTNGTSGFRFQLMVGGVAVTTNYTATQPVISGTAITTAPATITNGFACPTVGTGSSTHGQIVLCSLNTSTWVANGLFYDSNPTERVTISVGRASSVGTVDGIRVTTSGGTDTFDAGSINILYE